MVASAPAASTRSAPGVRPLAREHLRRTTRARVALEAALARLLASRPLAPSFASDLDALLEKHLQAPCTVLPPDIVRVSAAELPRLVPATACLAVLGAAPGADQLVLEVDLGLAALAVDRLLGGRGPSSRVLRPLTDIEEGVLSFLLLEVLACFTRGLAGRDQVVLTLERLASSADELGPVLDTAPELVVLGTRVSVGEHVGYARLLVPARLLAGAFGAPVSQSGAPRDPVSARALRAAIADLPVVATAVLAELADLSAADVAELEPGDILVLDGSEVVLADGGLDGVVTVKIGTGRNGRLRCRLGAADPSALEIVDVVVVEEPVEGVMGEERAGVRGGGEPPAGAEGLLRDVPAPLVVELGRLRLSAAQVVRLEKGQVLRLSRTPSDPVDLVVQGKVLARGELVDVEGELGVRILQIAGGE